MGVAHGRVSQICLPERVSWHSISPDLENGTPAHGHYFMAVPYRSNLPKLFVCILHLLEREDDNENTQRFNKKAKVD